jgi:hypothetical protein
VKAEQEKHEPKRKMQKKKGRKIKKNYAEYKFELIDAAVRAQVAEKEERIIFIFSSFYPFYLFAGKQRHKKTRIHFFKRTKEKMSNGIFLVGGIPFTKSRMTVDMKSAVRRVLSNIFGPRVQHFLIHDKFIILLPLFFLFFITSQPSFIALTIKNTFFPGC